MSHSSDQVRGKVTYYGYRKARASEIFLTVPRSTVETLIQQLAAKAKVRPDNNHEVYAVEQDGKMTYIWVCDFEVHFGHEMVPGELA